MDRNLLQFPRHRSIRHRHHLCLHYLLFRRRLYQYLLWGLAKNRHQSLEFRRRHHLRQIHRLVHLRQYPFLTLYLGQEESYLCRLTLHRYHHLGLHYLLYCHRLYQYLLWNLAENRRRHLGFHRYHHLCLHYLLFRHRLYQLILTGQREMRHLYSILHLHLRLDLGQF